MNLSKIEDFIKSHIVRENINEFKYYRYNFDKNSNEIKIVTKAFCENNKNYFIRIFDNFKSNYIKINERCHFQDFLKTNGILVPNQKKINGQFISNMQIEGIRLNVLVEEAFNYTKFDNTNTDMSVYKKIGAECAKIHLISQKYSPCHKFISDFGTMNKIANLSTNIPTQYFEDERIQADYTFLLSLIKKHEDIISALLAASALPQGFVQGDMGEGNLFFDSNGNLMIIDFNISGVDVFVGDAIIQGVNLAWNWKNSSQIFNFQYDIWNNFIKGYVSHRPFNDNESSVFEYYFKLIYFTTYVQKNRLNQGLNAQKFKIHFNKLIEILL